MPYNIIGDIHGQDYWKDIIREDCVNIFVGDYFDSKHGRTVEEVVANFRDIIDFRIKHPETILLYGNHDLNYILDLDYRSRFSRKDYREIYSRLLHDTDELFYGVAYAIDDKTLVSHAGVTKEWYKKYLGVYNGENAHIVAKQINNLWQCDKNAFTFSANAYIVSDKWGESSTHSPLWIRSWILPHHNLFADTDITQIIGHTPHDDITQVAEHIVCVDCLHKRAKSFLWT